MLHCTILLMQHADSVQKDHDFKGPQTLKVVFDLKGLLFLLFKSGQAFSFFVF